MRYIWQIVSMNDRWCIMKLQIALTVYGETARYCELVKLDCKLVWLASLIGKELYVGLLMKA